MQMITVCDTVELYIDKNYVSAVKMTEEKKRRVLGGKVRLNQWLNNQGDRP